MQKTVLTKAVVLALAAFGANVASAQSSLTLYGIVDVAIDSVHKNAGLSPIVGKPAAPSSTVTRVSPSLGSQSSFGVKGVEDMGGGYKGKFILEGQFSADTGALAGQDGRMWGRQAYVALTTPVGEVRLGRQYAPIFYDFAATSVETIGGADMMASGMIVNTLQIRQDNQISYWLTAGDLTAALSYSPNAGVATKISFNRAPAASAGSSTGQVLGGATAADENSTGRGRTYGLFLNYTVSPELSVNAGYHRNGFGDAQVVLPDTTLMFNLDKYVGYALGAKYTIPGAGTKIAAIFHRGDFTSDAGTAQAPKINTFAMGVKHPIDQFAIGAELAYAKFANFTKGKDVGLMLIGDYNFSKRTRVYTRFGLVRDSAGSATPTQTPGLNLIGGPLPLLTTLGALEIPFFAVGGGSNNVDATSRFVAVGITHSF